MKTFLTSDWHLGEDRFAITQRPFATSGEHINYLIDRHNEKVQPDDFVYVLGDVFYQKADIDRLLPIINQFNGHKVLIRGNHDRAVSDEQFAPYFDIIIEDGAGLHVEFDGILCYLTHYPSQGRVDRFNLVGYIHSAWKFQLNSVNVGVDVHHFSPVDSRMIPFFLKSITEFYDADVWCAYAEQNSAFYEQRGRKTSYFGG